VTAAAAAAATSAAQVATPLSCQVKKSVQAVEEHQQCPKFPWGVACSQSLAGILLLLLLLLQDFHKQIHWPWCRWLCCCCCCLL
jgi:hypothetical protein